MWTLPNITNVEALLILSLEAHIYICVKNCSKDDEHLLQNIFSFPTRRNDLCYRHIFRKEYNRTRGRQQAPTSFSLVLWCIWYTPILPSLVWCAIASSLLNAPLISSLVSLHGFYEDEQGITSPFWSAVNLSCPCCFSSARSALFSEKWLIQVQRWYMVASLDNTSSLWLTAVVDTTHVNYALSNLWQLLFMDQVMKLAKPQDMKNSKRPKDRLYLSLTICINYFPSFNLVFIICSMKIKIKKSWWIVS